MRHEKHKCEFFSIILGCQLTVLIGRNVYMICLKKYEPIRSRILLLRLHAKYKIEIKNFAPCLIPKFPISEINFYSPPKITFKIFGESVRRWGHFLLTSVFQWRAQYYHTWNKSSDDTNLLVRFKA